MTQLENVDSEIVTEAVLAAPTMPREANSASVLVRDRRKYGFGSLGPLVVLAGIVALWYGIHFSLEEGRRFILPMPHVIVYRGFIEGVTLGGLFDVGRTVLSGRLALAKPFRWTSKTAVASTTSPPSA